MNKIPDIGHEAGPSSSKAGPSSSKAGPSSSKEGPSSILGSAPQGGFSH